MSYKSLEQETRGKILRCYYDHTLTISNCWKQLREDISMNFSQDATRRVEQLIAKTEELAKECEQLSKDFKEEWTK